METYGFAQGRKYVKAYTETANGDRSAVAFRTSNGDWLEAASWKAPSRTYSMAGAVLEFLYQRQGTGK